jgi:hypothetical protein
VREIFDRLATGDSLAGIRRDLENRGIPTPRAHIGKGGPDGRYRWSTSTVRDIASNPAYIAKRVYPPRTDVINPAAHRARARLAAHRRWHPGEDLDELTEQCLREIERSRIDEGIDDLAALAPKMTAGQLARLSRLANAQ